MGFNSTLVIFNDHLGSIKGNRDFGEEVAHAILNLPCEKPVRLPSGAGLAIETHHMSGYVPVLVGGNNGIALPLALGHPETTHENGEKLLLQELARKLGYSLRKKPTRG